MKNEKNHLMMCDAQHRLRLSMNKIIYFMNFVSLGLRMLKDVWRNFYTSLIRHFHQIVNQTL